MTSLLTVVLTGAAALLAAPASAWDVVPSPSPSHWSNLLRGVTSAGGNTVWAVGNQRDDATGRQRTLTQRWDGATWQTVPSPAGANEHDTLTAVAAASPTDLWAAGFTARSPFDPDSWTDPDQATPLLLRGDGTGWTSWPVAVPDGFAHLTGVDMVDARDGWAVGTHVPAGAAVPRGLILRWTGRTWVPVPAPDLGSLHLTGVSANHAADVWAVGYRGTSDAEPVTLHWDGLSWQQHKVSLDPAVPAALHGITTVSDRDAWAVGYTWKAGKRLALALHWDGRAWKRVPVDVNEEGTQFRGVAAVPGGVWAVGYHITEGFDAALVMRFTGAGFEKDAPPAPDGQNFGGSAVTGITATPAGELWAIGCSGPSTRILRRAT